jgi:3-oxoacyl-ACP reductase-like protein
MQHFQSEQVLANELRTELRDLDLKFSKEQAALTHERTEIERIVDELTRGKKNQKNSTDNFN